MKSCALEFEDKVAAGGEQVTTTVEASGVCQLTRLVVPDDVAPHFEVLQLKVRDVDQISYHHSTPARAIPAVVFGEFIEGNFLKIDTARPGDLVTLVVRNTSAVPRAFRARIKGVTSEEEAGSTESPRPWWTLPEASDPVWMEVWTEDTDTSRADHEGVVAAYRRIYGSNVPKAKDRWAPNAFGRCELLPNDVVVWYSHTDKSEIWRLKPSIVAARDDSIDRGKRAEAWETRANELERMFNEKCRQLDQSRGVPPAPTAASVEDQQPDLTTDLGVAQEKLRLGVGDHFAPAHVRAIAAEMDRLRSALSKSEEVAKDLRAEVAALRDSESKERPASPESLRDWTLRKQGEHEGIYHRAWWNEVEVATVVRECFANFSEPSATQSRDPAPEQEVAGEVVLGKRGES